MNRIFVYGTLLVPAVMEAVTGKNFTFEPATLPGYARSRIRGQIFPGITRDENQDVKGINYVDVDEKSLRRLDAFESDVYSRERVTVLLEDDRRVHAFTYIITTEHEGLLTGQDWDLERFKQDHLHAYLKRVI